MKRLIGFVGLVVLISVTLIGCSGSEKKTSTPTVTQAATQVTDLATPTMVEIGTCHEQPNTLPGGEVIRETDGFCLIYYPRSNTYLGLMSSSIRDITIYRAAKATAEAVLLSSPQYSAHKCEFIWGPVAKLAGFTSADQFTAGCPLHAKQKGATREIQ